MTAPTKDEFYAIAFDDVDANLSHEECEEWAEFMTAPTDAETIAALAAQLGTTPDDLSRYAAESVRAPTETPCGDLIPDGGGCSRPTWVPRCAACPNTDPLTRRPGQGPTETPSLCDECGKPAEDATETCSCGLEVCEACLDRKHYQCNEQVQS